MSHYFNLNDQSQQQEKQMASAFEFTPLDQDIEKGNTQIQIQTHRHCHCRRWETALRLALIVLFMVSAAVRVSKKPPPPPRPIPPAFSLNSLSVPQFNISEGELSATWDASMTISSDALNLTVHRMDASIWYEDQEALAWISPPLNQQQHLEKMMMMNVRFKTTGWEKDEPIIDDTVIAAMAENRKRGVIVFSLKMRVEGELSSGEWAFSFITYQTCPHLKLHFPSPEEGGAHAFCSGLTEWGHARSFL